MPQSCDVNATSAVHPAAWSAYVNATRWHAPLNAPHTFGAEARRALAQARATVARGLGAAADEIVFTSGGTEADALALIGVLGPEPCHCVATGIEHPAVLGTLAQLAQHGVEVTHVPVSQSGRVAVEAVATALRPHTRLVTIMAANNETGVVQPVADVGALCRARDVLLHCDAVQIVGKAPIDVSAWGVDLLAVAGHKVGAVPGIGALYVRRGVPLHPVIPTLEHNRSQDRVVNVPGAVSLAAAMQNLPNADEWAAWGQQRDQFEHLISAALPDAHVIGGDSPRVVNTSCIRFPNCEGDGLMMALDMAGWAVSTGSACSSGSIDPSPTLLAMGLTKVAARQCVRFSLPRDTTRPRVDALAAAVIDIVRRMRHQA